MTTDQRPMNNLLFDSGAVSAPSSGLRPPSPSRGEGQISRWICLLPLLGLASCIVPSSPESESRQLNFKETQRAETSKDAKQSDVIIVGAGISGLAAALELGRGGADVTLIDMSSVF